MVHSSTRTISSVIGGSTLTAPLLKSFILSMMTLLLSVKLSLLRPLMLLVLTKLLLMKLLLFTSPQKPDLLADLVEGEITGVETTQQDQDQDRSSNPTNLARSENE